MTLVSLLILCLGLWDATISVSAGPASPPPDPILWIDPARPRKGVGDTFDLYVGIDNAVDFGAYQCDIVFAPSIVQVISVQYGDFPGSTGRTVVPVGPNIDNDAGRVSFGASTAGSQEGPSGSGGVLAIVTLEARAVGSTWLKFEDVQVADTQGRTQEATTEDGFVTVFSWIRVYLPMIMKGFSP